MDEHQEEDAGAGDDHIEKVRRRAHAIWLDQGMVHGRDQEHWHEAEREIEAEEAGSASPKAVEPTESPVKGAVESPVKGAAESPVKGPAESPFKGAGQSPIKGAA
jgi:hypothetical protein